jgi:8-oxo-dGTP pyrophosphatase MutT (NUDIX family)
VEHGETSTSALARELREEIGIEVNPPTRPADALVHTNDVTLSIWLLDEWEGEPRNLQTEEHDAIGWFRQDQMAPLSLAHTDYVSLIGRIVFT